MHRPKDSRMKQRETLRISKHSSEQTDQHVDISISYNIKRQNLYKFFLCSILFSKLQKMVIVGFSEMRQFVKSLAGGVI